jgi:excinuclease UvrABC helicase subunit UvrB
VFLSFYPYLQDNPYIQDNDRYLFSNLIFIKFKIQNSKKRMSLIETLFSTRDETLAL